MWIEETMRSLGITPEVHAYLSAIVTIIGYRYGLIPNIELHKRNNIGKAKRISLPPQIKEIHQEMTDKEMHEKKLDERIIEFKNRLGEKLPQEQRILFNNNLQNLQIKENLRDRIRKIIFEKVSGGEVGGIYNSKENRIVIFKDIPKVIFHELMHMSSTIITENKRYCGFYNQIGRGINEGYTQYLTEKFFPEEFEKKEEEIYKLETNYAMKTAMLIGEDKMTELYFKANLHGLVEEITKYSNKKDTIEFINCIDKINTFSHSKNPFLIMKNEVIDSCMDYIFDFLVQAYSNKINSISGLTKEEKEKMIKEYEKEFYITERRYIESIENEQEKEKSR